MGGPGRCPICGYRRDVDAEGDVVCNECRITWAGPERPTRRSAPLKERELTPEAHKRRKVWNYITVREYVNKGLNELRPFQFFLYVGGTERAVSGAWGTTFVLAACFYSLAFVIGFVWDRRRYFETEREWALQRNPLAKDLRKKLKIHEGDK